MNSIWQDLRYGARMLMKQRGFTLIAVLMLGVGIGANTAIFSLVNAVLLRPLPYQQAGRLVMIWGNFLKFDLEHLPAKAAEYEDYRAQRQAFEQVAAYSGESFHLTGGDQPERIAGARVTANLFALLGAQAAQGRVISPEENQAGPDHVAVISHGLWQRRFGGDPAIVGKTVKLNDHDYTVVGLMPADFEFPPASFPFAESADVWIPLVYSVEQVNERRGPYYLQIIARLKAGVTLAQARAEMDALADAFERQHRGYRGPSGEDGGWRISLAPLQEEIVGGSHRALLVLFGAVGLVLLIACANVANLLLARATARQKELAIRSALGASRFTLVRQLLVESLWLAALGGAAGLLLAGWGVDALTALSPDNLPRVKEVSVDGRIVAFTATLSLLTGLIFGLLPALQASKLDLTHALKEGGAPGEWRRGRARSVLVSTEVALSLVLLVGAGLLIKSFMRLQQVNPGLAADRLLTVEINLPASRYREPARTAAFYRDLVQRVAALPGVESASAGTVQPLSGVARHDPFSIEGRPLDPSHLTSAGWQMVGPHYFRTLGIPLVEGRDLLEQDDETTAAVAIVNAEMARQYWPNESPIGRRLTLGLPRPDNPWFTIIGVAQNLPHRAIDSRPEPDWYLSRALPPPRDRYLFVRTAVDPAALAPAIRHQVSAIDRDQPVTSIRTMNEVIASTVAPRRFNLIALGIFAAVALMLAALGIYGVISYTVAQRAHEIGIRMALGAPARQVLGMILKQGMTLALAGAGIGLLAAFALMRLLEKLLFGVRVTDPLTYILVALLLLAVALAACWIPARRATKVDPMIALRCE